MGRGEGVSVERAEVVMCVTGERVGFVRCVRCELRGKLRLDSAHN